MIFGFVVVVGVVFVVMVWRARRADTRAGLNAARPTFSAEPPSRRAGSRKAYRL